MTRVHFGLGDDIDAARRLVEDQDPSVPTSATRPSTTFCWLPPERETDLLHGRAGPHEQTALERGYDSPALRFAGRSPASSRAAKALRDMLVETDSIGARPIRCRSSGTKATPAVSAAAGRADRGLVRPSTTIAPPSTGARPNSAIASSERPAPMMP